MLDRVQISCEKQGRNETSSWSTRVLTIDARTKTLTISRHHHPNNVFYHSIQLTEVMQWPHFDASTIDDDFHSPHAKRTLLVLGIEVPVPSFSLQIPEVHSGDLLRPGESSMGETSAVSSSSSAAAPCTFMAGDPTKHSRPVETGGVDSWVLRFTTQASYDTAMEVLHRFPGVHVNHKHDAKVMAAATAMLPLPLLAAPIGPM